MNSVLTRNQEKIYGPKPIDGWGRGGRITATVRHDDRCGNGYNTFSITGEISTSQSRRIDDIQAGGCIHKEIAEHFPELAPLIKWHLMSKDGPMHYLANSLYWAGKTKWEKPNLEHFRSTAVWPEATEETMALNESDLTAALEARLPALLAEFRQAVESIGFTY